jgi:hypothetical protein
MWARLRGEPESGPVMTGDWPGAPDATALYHCVIWRERPLGWLLGRKMVEQFVTALDPGDGDSLQHALAAAVYRDAGADADQAVLLTYSLDVHDRATGDLIVDGYRYTTWL